MAAALRAVPIREDRPLRLPGAYPLRNCVGGGGGTHHPHHQQHQHQHHQHYQGGREVEAEQEHEREHSRSASDGGGGGCGTGGSANDGGSTSGESSLAMLDHEKSFEDAGVHIHKHVPGAPSDG